MLQTDERTYGQRALSVEILFQICLQAVGALWENPVQLIKSEFLFLNTFLGLLNALCYVLIH